MTEQKRSGPRMLPIAWSCLGCEHDRCSREQYGAHTIPMRSCGHPSVRVGGVGRSREEQCGSLKTPDWCPLLPKRKAIGTCSECGHFEDGVCAGNGIMMNSYILDENARTFGCIHWEAKP